MIIFKELLNNIEIQEMLGEEQDLELVGVDSNSKKIKQGFAFLALKGHTVDGHDYIENAIMNGAVLVICEDMPIELRDGVVYVRVENTTKIEWILANNFYGKPSETLNIFGITGTNGKTTVAKMVHELTKIAGNKSGYAGTIGIEYNNEFEETQNTTASPLEMQKMLRKMVDMGIKDVAIEVSSHALILERVRGTEIKIGGFTNLSQDHLDFHETMGEYSNAKEKLFSEYVSGSDKFSVINIDDAVGKRYSKVGNAKLITYSLKEEFADLYAFEVELGSKDTRFKLKFNDEVYEVSTNLVGEFNVYNVLCAMGVMLSKGYRIDEVIWMIKQFKTVKGRMEFIENRHGKAVYVDYAHTPDGIENVLRSVNEFKKGKSVIVFGCGGDRDKTKRPIMASIAESFADRVYITSDNPRTEKPEEIINDVLKGIDEKQKVVVEIDRAAAIKRAINEMDVNDVLVVAGKGHEDYQIIGREKIYFSDAEVIKGV